MSIGGIDVVLRAPAHPDLGDVILETCQEFWAGKECVFQDADDEQAHSFKDRWVWSEGVASGEFFVFRDRNAADSWSAEGASAKNVNTMFHFIIGDNKDLDFVEVAMVCDKMTPAVRRFLKALKANFKSLAAVK